MIRGQAINVSLSPLNKDVAEEERFEVDLRNVRITDANNMKKRNGYDSQWSVSNDNPVDALIPEGTGYMILKDGSYYKIGDLADTPQPVYTSAPLPARPTYIDWNDIIYVYSGAPVTKIDASLVSLVGGGVPNGKFAAIINSYVIVAGYHDTEFASLVFNNPELFDISLGARNYNIQKNGTIKNMIEYRNNLYFFKEREIEVWVPTGTDPPVRRQASLTIDKGLGSVYSVVKANNTFYWFGHDGDFYVYSGGNPVNISAGYRLELNKLKNDDIYGFDIRKENVIMWFSPSAGKTFVYDYHTNTFSEDNEWNEGTWQALPFNSYMELNGEQYFGSSKYDDGTVWNWSSDTRYDGESSVPIRVLRRVSRPLTESGNKARVNRMQFRRKGNLTSDGTEQHFTVRWRFDKGQWSLCTPLTLGVLGDNSPYTAEIVGGIGSGTEIEIEVVESDNVEFLLTDIILTVEGLRK